MNKIQVAWLTGFVVLVGCRRAVSEPAPAGPAEAAAPAAADLDWVEAVDAGAQRLHRAHPGAVVRIVVVHVETGDVLAATGPTEQPHATGSTVKSFAVAAALDAGVTAQDTLETGDGSVTYAGGTIRDYRAHGRLTVEQALARSSNVAVVRLVERVGERELYRRVAAMIPVPDRDTLDDQAAVGVLCGAGLSLSIVDLARGYAMLAAGGIDPRTGQARVGRPAAQRVVQMLHYAVDSPEGTGNEAAVAGLRIGGKTGTAPTGEGTNTASFIGVAEIEGHRYVVGVVLEGVADDVSGGTAAAPAFARIVSGAIRSEGAP